MNLIYTQLKTLFPKFDSRRYFSRTIPKTAKKNSCEETDCCGKPINVEPKPEIYIERACHPCSFYTWKPKIPILESAPPLVASKKKPFKKQHCYAGMKITSKCLAEIKAEAAECQKRNAIVPCCTPPPPPPPPKVEEKKTECDDLPLPDWDSNGCIK